MGAARVLLVPVEDAAHERGDQRDAVLGAGDGLVQAEQQGQVAVDAFLLQHGSGLDAFPGGGDLDEDALLGDAGRVILGDDLAGLLDRALGIEGQAGINLGGDAARDDVQDLQAEGYGQAVECQGHHFRRRSLGTQGGARALQGVFDDGLVLRHQSGGGDQRRVGRGVLRLDLFDGLDISGVGHNHGDLAELFE